MDITYNNLSSPSDIVTFTEVPNILKIREYMDGTKATFTFEFSGNLRATVTADSQYYVSFLGETVTNVMDNKKAKNRRFFISEDPSSTAMSFAQALRNCSIGADFNVIHNGGESVTLLAKTVGKKWSDTPNYLQKNIPDGNLTTYGTDGSVSSSLFNAKIFVDVFSGSAMDNNNYVTTLEKNFYGDDCSFDMSPVLATLSEYGKTKPYTFKLNYVTEEGEWDYITSISGNTVIGYHANQSDKYKYAQYVQLLLNKNRGNGGTMTLYTYYNKIDYSVLCGSNTGGWNIVVSVKSSANEEIWNSGAQTDHRGGSNYLLDREFTIPSSVFSQGYYVDFTVGTDTTRFNIIKPLKATEYCQRVLWRNEYGGISFFDFTGSRSESDSVDIDTYEKNVFDYYDTEEFERKMIYDNGYKKSVSLTSHLMEEDGKWIFNSLMRSKKVWTEVNGKTYYIIPKSIDVQEDSTYNNIYTAKLTYEYSDI